MALDANSTGSPTLGSLGLNAKFVSGSRFLGSSTGGPLTTTSRVVASVAPSASVTVRVTV